MRHLDPLPHPAEENGVIPDNVAGPDGLNADFLFGPLSDHPFSGIDADLIQVAIDGAREYGDMGAWGSSFLARPYLSSNRR